MLQDKLLVLIFGKIAFEFWDHGCVDVVKSHMTVPTQYPIEGQHAFYALLETQGSNGEHDQEVFNAI